MGALKKAMASVAALTLVASSTAAAAAPAATPAPVAQPQAPDAWMMLSALGPTRVVALGGANVAAQPADVPPPPPPPEAAGAAGFNGEVLPFLIWFGLIALALTSSGDSERPNSPA